MLAIKVTEKQTVLSTVHTCVFKVFNVPYKIPLFHTFLFVNGFYLSAFALPLLLFHEYILNSSFVYFETADDVT